MDKRLFFAFITLILGGLPCRSYANHGPTGNTTRSDVVWNREQRLQVNDPTALWMRLRKEGVKDIDNNGVPGPNLAGFLVCEEGECWIEIGNEIVKVTDLFDQKELNKEFPPILQGEMVPKRRWGARVEQKGGRTFIVHHVGKLRCSGTRANKKTVAFSLEFASGPSETQWEQGQQVRMGWHLGGSAEGYESAPEMSFSFAKDGDARALIFPHKIGERVKATFREPLAESQWTIL